MIEIPGYEKEIIYYLPEHLEDIDEYCLFLSNLYENSIQIRNYEIQRLVYRYLENHKLVLHQLTEMVPDRFNLWHITPEEFLHSQLKMSNNLLGNICSVFSKSFKISVVLKDKEAMRIMHKSLQLFDKAVSLEFIIMMDNLGLVISDMIKELREMDSKLNEIIKRQYQSKQSI
jgi:hypothetical protein